MPGTLAQGAVTLTGSRGRQLSGTISVSEAGPDHCSVVMDLGSTLVRRRYTAVMDGNRVEISGPAGLLRSAPLPLRRGQGCGLLPVGHAATLSLSLRGQAISLVYTAAAVTESVGGEVRLRAVFSSIAPHTFAARDFALPPTPAAAPAGGAQ